MDHGHVCAIVLNFTIIFLSTYSLLKKFLQIMINTFNFFLSCVCVVAETGPHVAHNDLVLLTPPSEEAQATLLT